MNSPFLLAVLATVHFWQQPAEPHVVRFQVPVPDTVTLDPTESPVISPDGRRFVFVGAAPNNKGRLWVHSLDSIATQLLPGTQDAGLPFWSPDSRFVGFVTADRKLEKIDVAKGAVQMLCRVGDFGGGTWSREGVILFGRRAIGPNSCLMAGIFCIARSRGRQERTMAASISVR